jgi:hypothetical protein
MKNFGMIWESSISLFWKRNGQIFNNLLRESYKLQSVSSVGGTADNAGQRVSIPEAV